MCSIQVLQSHPYGSSSTAMAVSNEVILLGYEKSNVEPQGTHLSTETRILLLSQHFLNPVHQQSPCIIIKCRIQPTRGWRISNILYSMSIVGYKGVKIARNSCMSDIRSSWKPYLVPYRYAPPLRPKILNHTNNYLVES